MRREEENKQPFSLTIIKTVAVFMSLFLLFLLALNITSYTFTYDLSLMALIALFFGYLLADLITGTVHWFCDNFFSEKTPIIGKVIIHPFREHHLYPLLITEDKFIEQDTTSFFIFIPFLYHAVFFGNNYLVNPSLIYFHFLLIGVCFGTFCTNLFHKWAHQENNNVLIIRLQKFGLILSPDNHLSHHLNHSKSYCVTSGILNPFLDHIEFFPKAEQIIRSIINVFRR